MRRQLEPSMTVKRRASSMPLFTLLGFCWERFFENKNLVLVLKPVLCSYRRIGPSVRRSREPLRHIVSRAR